MRALHHVEIAVWRSLRNLVEFAFLNVVAVGVVATSILLLGMFVLILVNLSGVMERWGRDVQVYAYFADGVSEERCFEIKEEIEALPEVRRVRYISKEEALQTFRRLIPDADELLADLESNPLPPSLEIQLTSELRDPTKVGAFAREIDRPAFAELDYAAEWVGQFYTFLNLLKLSAVVMGTLLALACLVIVSTTIQLTIWARRDEIEIFRLVGATDRFIQAPFLIEGAVQGALGALTSVALLWVAYRLVFVALQDVLGITGGARVLTFLSTPTLALFVAGGLTLGLLGSWLSLRRLLDKAR